MGYIDVLAEFKAMHDSLSAKTGPIYHAEVPKELLLTMNETPTKRTSTPPLEDNDDIPSTKKQKTEQSRPPNPNTWHPKLLAALADPLKRAGNPSHSKILKYCEATARDIVPQGSKICASNYFFGKCYDNKACKKIHQVATDEDAEKNLKLCDKFIRDPVPLKSSFKKVIITSMLFELKKFVFSRHCRW